MRHLLPLAALISALLPSAAGAATAAEGRQALLAADEAWAKATAEHRIEGWVAGFAEEGSMVTPSGPLATGKKAIHDFMAGAFADPAFSLSWKPLLAEVASSGDLGYTIGDYELHTQDVHGHPALRTGRYTTVWKKQKDGGWKVVVDIGNVAPPAPPEKAAEKAPEKPAEKPAAKPPR